MLNQSPLNFFPNAVFTDLDPLIVTSPTPRSGTTLLQRLLCSSPSTLIFGEKCAHDLELFLNIYTYKVQEYNFQREKYQQDLEKVLRGEVNDWILDLTPDIDGYLAAMQRAAFAGISFSRDYALSVGRPVWGFKYPGWNPMTIRLLKAVLPKAYFLFIYRDIVSCLKSAKAQYLVTTEQEVRTFCQQWTTSMAYLNTVTGDGSMLAIRFEDLIEQPERIINDIAVFSGVRDMDRSVLDHKINVWAGQDFSTQVRDGYIAPVELSQVELSIVDELTAAIGL